MSGPQGIHTERKLPCSQQTAGLVSFLRELGADGLGNNSSVGRFGCQVQKNKDIRQQRLKNKEVLLPSFKCIRNPSLGSRVWKPCQLVSPFRLACVIGHWNSQVRPSCAIVTNKLFQLLRLG